MTLIHWNNKPPMGVCAILAAISASCFLMYNEERKNTKKYKAEIAAALHPAYKTEKGRESGARLSGEKNTWLTGWIF